MGCNRRQAVLAGADEALAGEDPMIPIAVTETAFAAVAETLSFGSVAYEVEVEAQGQVIATAKC